MTNITLGSEFIMNAVAKVCDSTVHKGVHCSLHFQHREEAILKQSTVNVKVLLLLLHVTGILIHVCYVYYASTPVCMCVSVCERVCMVCVCVCMCCVVCGMYVRVSIR